MPANNFNETAIDAHCKPESRGYYTTFNIYVKALSDWRINEPERKPLTLKGCF
jgi:hypothetical protein